MVRSATTLMAILLLGLVLGAGLGYYFGASGAESSTVISTTTVTTTVAGVTTVSSTTTETVTEVETNTVTVTTTITTQYPVELVDAAGNTVVLETEPTRVVSLSPAITETIFALNAQDKLVGVDNSSDYPQELEQLVAEGKVRRVGGYWWSALDLEAIAELQPDLVIAEVGAHIKIKDQFEQLGLKVLYVRGGAARSVEDVKADILLIGQALNRMEEARSVTADIDAKVAEITSRLEASGAEPVPVYVEVGAYSGQLWGAGAGTFIDALITVAGGSNVLAAYSGYPQLGYEDVVAAQPSVIIATASYMDPGMAQGYLDEIVSRPGWSEVPAVRDGRVYVLAGQAANVLVRPGPRIVEALDILAKILHPEIFGEPAGPEIVSPAQLAAPKPGPPQIAVPVV